MELGWLQGLQSLMKLRTGALVVMAFVVRGDRLAGSILLTLSPEMEIACLLFLSSLLVSSGPVPGSHWIALLWMGIRAQTNSVGSRHDDGSVNWNHVPGKLHRCEMTLGLGGGATPDQIYRPLLGLPEEKCPLKNTLFSLRRSLISWACNTCVHHYGFIKGFCKRKKKAPNECFYIYW